MNREVFEKQLYNHGSQYELCRHVQPPNRYFSLSAKMNGTQRRALVSPRRMHCMYCGMPKGTSRDEVTLNSEKSSVYIALVIVELRWSEGIRRAGRQAGRWAGGQAGSRKLNLKKILQQLVEGILGLVDMKAWFYLTNAVPSSSRKIVVGF